MADDTTNRGPADANRININQPHEVKYWAKRFGVSPEQLKEGVQAAGTMAAEVQRYLGKTRSVDA
jgi:hypothetical protein